MSESQSDTEVTDDDVIIEPIIEETSICTITHQRQDYLNSLLCYIYDSDVTDPEMHSLGSDADSWESDSTSSDDNSVFETSILYVSDSARNNVKTIPIKRNQYGVDVSTVFQLEQFALY